MTDDADTDDLAVRRLLADARSTEPMPDDVAARMDAVLADLAAGATQAPVEPAAPAQEHPVVVALSRQRRRRAAGMLVAAAAIVVGGVVVAQHLPQSTDPASTAGADRSQADSLDTNGSSAGKVPSAKPPRDQSRAEATVQGGRVLVRPQHFTADALAARQLLDQKAPASQYAELRQADVSCVAAGTPGERAAATYQRAPAVLVFHAPASGSQVVDLFVCGSQRPVRSATLPAG